MTCRKLLLQAKGFANPATLCFRDTESGHTHIPIANLPGWRWAAIKKVALDRLSRSLHSDVCDSDGCCDAVVHSTISGSGNRRTRAVPNITYIPKLYHFSCVTVTLLCVYFALRKKACERCYGRTAQVQRFVYTV